MAAIALRCSGRWRRSGGVVVVSARAVASGRVAGTYGGEQVVEEESATTGKGVLLLLSWMPAGPG